MSGFSAATTYNIAYNTVLAQKIDPIESTDLGQEEWNKFYKSILRAAKSVPTTLGGGKWGHVYLIKNEAGYKKYTGNSSLVQDRMKQPAKKATIPDNATEGQIAMLRDQNIANKDLYYTQEGTYAGLMYLTVNNEPRQLIKEKEHIKDGLEGVELLELLEHVQNKHRLQITQR